MFEANTPDAELTTPTEETPNEQTELEEGVDDNEGADEEQVDLEGEGGEQDPDNGFLPGQYASTEEILAAYRQQALPQQQPPTQPQYQQSPEETGNPSEMFWDLFRNDPLGTMQYLIEQGVQQRVAPIYEERAGEAFRANLDRVGQEFPQIKTQEGIQGLYGKVQEIARELGNPNLAQNPSQRILRMAAQELHGNNQQVYQQALQKGKQQADEARRMKQGLNSSAAKNAKPAEKSVEEQIAESIVGAGRRNGIFG